MRSSFRALLSFFLLMLQLPLAGAQSIELDPPRIYAGDVTRLNIAYESDIPSLYALDTQALEQDFDVLRLNSRVSRITDRQTAGSRMEWTLELAPKRSGKLAIPPIRLGDKQTPPASLRVDPNGVETGDRADVFIRLEADPPRPYVTQQTRILMTLYHASPLVGGRWYEPKTDAGKVLHSGHEVVDAVEIDGVRYRRTERSLALFPASDGSLDLSPAAIVGDLNQTPALDPRGIYQRGATRTLYRRSDPLRLEVKPIPANHDSPYWLPAFAMKMTQEWDDGDSTLTAGDTLQRTITIEARGLPADALPGDLLVEPAEAIRVFPDQPLRGNRFEADILVGRLRQSFAVLLTRAGEVELPPLELAWWDLNDDRARVVRLPGRVIRVAASGDPALDGIGSAGREFVGEFDAVPPDPWQKALILALILALYLLWAGFGDDLQCRFVVAWRRFQVLRRLRQACDGDDPQVARRVLLNWARQEWPDRPTFGLMQIRQRLATPELSAALTALDAAIYAADAGGWRGRELWRALQRARRLSVENHASRTVGSGLYPQFAKTRD